MKEQHRKEINELYKEILCREADEAGLEYYCTLLEKGDDLKNIRTQILSSEEALLIKENRESLSKYGVSYKEITDNYFKEIFLRPANTKELEYYSSLLENKKIVIREFRDMLLKSEEFRKKDFSNKSMFKESTFFKDCSKKEIEIFQKLKKHYQDGFGYHTFKFQNGYIVNGEWDMSKFLSFYSIPDKLDGKTVLEVGPSTGFFSFELARRGASVVAIDKYRYSWFDDLNKLMSTSVKFKVQDLATIDESFGKFDIVFCSNVLLHTPDLFSNLKRIKMVTKDKAILATILMDYPRIEHVSLAKFEGISHELKGGKIEHTFWLPNMNGFKKMLAVGGYSKVDEIADFHIVSDYNEVLREGIVHCYV